MRTLQEKYNAIKEGKFDKSQFLRDARMQLPSLVSQFSSYSDVISIMKSKGMLVEYEAPVSKYSLDTLERGIDTELEKAGVDTATETPSLEVYNKAKKAAEANLEKNPNHYIDLISKESNKVDKHDQMKKYSEKEAVDKFNGLKKADLREAVVKLLNKKKESTSSKVKPVIKEGRSIMKGDIVTDKRKAFEGKFYKILSFDHDQGVLDIDDNPTRELACAEVDKRGSRVKGTPTHTMDGGDIGKILANLQEGRRPKMKGGKNVTEADYETGGYVEAMGPMLDKCIDSLISVWEEWKSGPATEPEMIPHAKADLLNYIKSKISVEDPTLDEFDHTKNLDPSQIDNIEHLQEDHSGNPNDKYVVKKGKGFAEYEVWEGNVKVREFSGEGAKEKADKFASKENKEQGLKESNVDLQEANINNLRYQLTQVLKRNGGDTKAPEARKLIIQINNLKKKGSELDEKASCNKTNEKYMEESSRVEQLKEGIKYIITKVLTEGKDSPKILTEAATENLAKMLQSYEDFEGMQNVINSLENIVTDIESYYGKTRDKIQKIIQAAGDIRNAEGDRIGPFLTPAIESAFMKDLEPIKRKGFTQGITHEKVPVAKNVPTNENEKDTVFTPITEGKKTKYTNKK